MKNRLAILTQRELEIATLLSRGLAHKQICELLDRKHATIEAHRANIYRKLGVHNLASLTRIVVESEPRDDEVQRETLRGYGLV